MAARYKPHLVRRIVAAGHEIGLHGNSHRPLSELTREAAYEDIRISLETISDEAGQRPFGFRAPYFSIDRSNLYILEILAELGFEYDTSIFPVRTPYYYGHYGVNDFPTADALYRLPNDLTIVELPLTTLEVSRRRWPIAGGSCFRLLPRCVIRRAFARLARDGISPMIYMHPYEFDNRPIDCAACYPPDQSYPLLRRVLVNVRWNLFRRSITPKICSLLKSHEFVTCRERAHAVREARISPTILE